MAAEPRLLHRIFIGVETSIVIPDPPDADILLLEDGGAGLKEDNGYILLENN